MKRLSLLILAVCIYPVSVYAGKPIAKCVTANGEQIFTDHYCETVEPGNSPFLMSESAINPSVRARIPSVVRADAIATSQLKSATQEAQSQCAQQFARYFKRKHPSIGAVPAIEFSKVVDQFKKGANISVSLSGTIEYVDSNYAVNSSIECTVQRFKPTSDWIVGFRER